MIHDICNPRVTVVVVTYNSAQYVADTLDSVYRQDYPGDIELIVSDDGSTDDTGRICRGWIETYGNRFSTARFIRTPHNLGICGNYNFALGHVTGEWVKYIAGDDMLTPDCLSEFVAATSKSDDKFWLCRVIPFSHEGEELDRLKCVRLVNKAVSIQERILSNSWYIVEGPSLFLETQTLRNLGGFDERYPLVEDWPLAMRYVFNGFHIGVVDKPLVKYREYHQSVSKEGSPYYVRFRSCCYSALNDWRMAIARRDRKPLDWWHAYVQRRLVDLPRTGWKNKIRRYLLMGSDVKRLWQMVR